MAGRRGGDAGEVGAAMTGGGPSQVGVSGALRARDVSRPAQLDYAEAERLVVVSKQPPRYRPPLTGGRRGAPGDSGGPGAGQGRGGTSPDRS